MAQRDATATDDRRGQQAPVSSQTFHALPSAAFAPPHGCLSEAIGILPAVRLVHPPALIVPQQTSFLLPPRWPTRLVGPERRIGLAGRWRQRHAFGCALPYADPSPCLRSCSDRGFWCVLVDGRAAGPRGRPRCHGARVTAHCSLPGTIPGRAQRRAPIRGCAPPSAP